jgi:serine/threonine protein kinase
MSDHPRTVGDTGAVDQVIANRYRLCEMIGRGGMGCVWRAEHVSLRTPVAIKLLRPEVAQRDEWRVRFLREAQAAAELRSRHVVHILDHGIDEGLPYLAMEYLKGQSLQAHLKKKGVLTRDETAMVMRGVLRAISRAHRAGIVHRDLKPDNIFLADDDDSSDPWIVKVLDFGIAKMMDERSVDGDVSTRTGITLGTPFYMSPEQTMGMKDLDARSDLWSLGAIAFECLTGKRAFEADAIGGIIMKICSKPLPVPSAIAEVPAGFDAWFAKANQREPKDRFQTAQAFAAALADVLSPGQRWLDSRADELSTNPADTPQGSPSATFVDAPTEPSNPPGATTGQAASRTVIPKAGRHRSVVVGAVALAAALGVGFLATRADTPSEGPTKQVLSAAQGPVEAASNPPGEVPPPLDGKAVGEPARPPGDVVAASSPSSPVVAPPPSAAPSASGSTAPAPQASSSAATPPGGATSPRPPAPNQRPAPPRPPTAAASVNLGI